LNNKAILLFELNKPDSSLYYFKRSLSIRQSIGNQKGIAESFYNLGDYYRHLNDDKRALEYFQKSMNYAKRKKLMIDERDALAEIISIKKQLVIEEGVAEHESRLNELQGILDDNKSLNQDIIDYVGSISATSTSQQQKSEDIWAFAPLILLIILICGIITIKLVAK